MALSEEEKNEKEILRSSIVKRIRSIRKKKFTDKAIDNFSWSFRVFLIKFLSLGYEFTHEELLRETSKVNIKENLRNRILAISDSLEEIKYGSKIISKEDFLWMLDEAERIINFAIIGKEFTEWELEQQESAKKERIAKKELKERKVGITQKLENNFYSLFGIKGKGVQVNKIKKHSKKRIQQQLIGKDLSHKLEGWKVKGYDTEVLEKVYLQELSKDKRK